MAARAAAIDEVLINAADFGDVEVIGNENVEFVSRQMAQDRFAHHTAAGVARAEKQDL